MSAPLDVIFDTDGFTLAKRIDALERLVLAVVRAQAWAEWAADVLADQNDGLPSRGDKALATGLLQALRDVEARRPKSVDSIQEPC